MKGTLLFFDWIMIIKSIISKYWEKQSHLFITVCILKNFAYKFSWLSYYSVWLLLTPLTLRNLFHDCSSCINIIWNFYKWYLYCYSLPLKFIILCIIQIMKYPLSVHIFPWRRFINITFKCHNLLLKIQHFI